MKHFDLRNNEAYVTKEMQLLIEQEIKDGYISRRKHPEFNYYVLNYTNSCQIKWQWAEATKFCRGLIVNDKWKLIARSYYKFFTLDQIEDSDCDVLPSKTLDYSISAKKDGFLGILYFSPDGEAFISTRGSFESEMAVRATKMLRERYADLTKELDRNYSYSLEIIYPNDMLTLVYDEEKLVLHGVFDNRTGEEISLTDFDAPWFSREDSFEIEFPVETGTAWKGLEDFYSKYSYDYDEGYVITFHPTFHRVKVKFDEYKEMSRAKNSLGAPGSKRYLMSLASGKIDEVLVANPLIASSILGLSVGKWKKLHATRLDNAKMWLDQWKTNSDESVTIRDLGLYFSKVNVKDSGVIISLFLEDEHADEKLWKNIIKENKNSAKETE